MAAQTIRDRILGDEFAVYANPFSERHEVRGYKQTGAISLRSTDGLDHGAYRAFAICAGDVNDFARSGGLQAAEAELEIVPL